MLNLEKLLFKIDFAGTYVHIQIRRYFLSISLFSISILKGMLHNTCISAKEKINYNKEIYHVNMTLKCIYVI